MPLTHIQVTEFQELWKNQTGQDIDPDTARKRAENLLGLMRLVLLPSTNKPEQDRPP